MSLRLLAQSRPFRISLVALKGMCLYHFILSHLFEIRPCGGASMLPTLRHSGDFIIHSPLLLRLSLLSPEKRRTLRGTLVTAVSPLDPGSEVLKRVVGVEGDTVCVDPSGERKGREDSSGRGVGEGVEGWVKVPKGHVWLAGDNTSNSVDSRDYGPVPLGLLKGKVVGRLWPQPGWLDSNLRKVDAVA